MRHRLQRLVTFVSIGLLLGWSGCDWTGGFSTGTATPNASSSSTEHSEESGAHYSSFGIRTDAEKFEVISFKDVGLDRTNPSPSDALLEAIAQSVAYEINQRGDLHLRPRVFHDETLADPAKHTYCEDERLYVDIWRSDSPERWGYSLWSGCSASQNFASKEVPMQSGSEEAEVEEQVEPLSEHIVDSLAEAVDQDCFRRAC